MIQGYEAIELGILLKRDEVPLFGHAPANCSLRHHLPPPPSEAETATLGRLHAVRMKRLSVRSVVYCSSVFTLMIGRRGLYLPQCCTELLKFTEYSYFLRSSSHLTIPLSHPPSQPDAFLANPRQLAMPVDCHAIKRIGGEPSGGGLADDKMAALAAAALFVCARPIVSALARKKNTTTSNVSCSSE